QAVAESAHASKAATARARFRQARRAGFQSRLASAGPLPRRPDRAGTVPPQPVTPNSRPIFAWGAATAPACPGLPVEQPPPPAANGVNGIVLPPPSAACKPLPFGPASRASAANAAK